MKKLIFIGILCITSFAVVHRVEAQKKSNRERALMLIERNIFQGNKSFPIKKPYFHQYGSIHVDGPSGGALYRFVTNSEAVDWVINRWALKAVNLETRREFFNINSEALPKWWNLDQVSVEVYYKLKKQYQNGGTETKKLLYEKESATVYIVESYENWPGI